MLGNRGQQLGEYAVLIGVVASAFIAMQMYMSNRVAGALIARTHAILGNMQPSDQGTNSSNTTDTLRETGGRDNIHTEAFSRSTGESHAGHFLLAQAYGPYVFAALSVDDPSYRSIVAELAGQVDPSLLGDGYQLDPGDLTIDADGRVTAVFKKSKEEKAKEARLLTSPWGGLRGLASSVKGDRVVVSYKVLSLRFDRRNGVWWAALDTNGDNQVDVFAIGVPEKVSLIASVLDRKTKVQAWVASLREVLTLHEKEKEYDLPESDRIDIERAIAAGGQIITRISQGGDLEGMSVDKLKELDQSIAASGPTLQKGLDTAQRVDQANAKKRTEKSKEAFFQRLHWGPSKGDQLVKRGDLSLDTLREMVDGAFQMESALDQEGQGLEHKQEIKDHLKAAKGFLEKFDPRFDPRLDRGEQRARRDFQGAADELDQAYNLLVKDVDAAVGQTQKADNTPQSTPTEGAAILGYYAQRPGGGQSLEGAGPQFDVAVDGIGDGLPDVIKVDGQYQSVSWHILKPGELIADDGEGGASGIPFNLGSGLMDSKTPKVSTIPSGPVPSELISAVGKSPDDFKNTNAWIPLTPAAEEAAAKGETGPPEPGVTHAKPLKDVDTGPSSKPHRGP